MSAERNRLYGYMDYNATAPLRPEVEAVLLEVLRGVPGNPSSMHRLGVGAAYRVEKARRSLARSIGTQNPSTIVYTAGGSEADNLALRGVAFHRRRDGNHLIVSAAEHKAVLDTAIDLRDNYGFQLTILPVDEWGAVRPVDLKAALRPETILVSIILANNEVGTINPVQELASITHKQSTAAFHTDAVQALGKIPVNVEELGVDLATFGAHKIGGPRGVGALYVREGIELAPQITGGGQEQDRRAGTENTAGVVAFAEAARLAVTELDAEAPRLEALREDLFRRLQSAGPGVVRNSPVEGCLPNTLNISVPGFPSRDFVQALDQYGFAVSSGSACTSEGGEPSHVLVAMKAGEERARSAVRISLGRTTTKDEVAAFAGAVKKACKETLHA